MRRGADRLAAAALAPGAPGARRVRRDLPADGADGRAPLLAAAPDRRRRLPAAHPRLGARGPRARSSSRCTASATIPTGSTAPPGLGADGILTFAYDQRGFGQSPRRGIWPGTQTLVADVAAAARAIRAAHPGLPLFLLGESMGGALAIVALTDPADPPDVDGAILVAAAVWGRQTMPFYQRWALWAAVNTVPWLAVDGEGFEVAVTDNIDALRALASDPLVLGAVRLDMLDGLVDLMGLALERAHLLDLPALVLYGEREEVVPPEPIEVLMGRLPPGPRRVALYPEGYHLLLRDLHAGVVIDDIAAWTRIRAGPSPRAWSGRSAACGRPPRPPTAEAEGRREGFPAGSFRAKVRPLAPGSVAQRIERCPPEAEAAGSNPAGSAS